MSQRSNARGAIQLISHCVVLGMTGVAVVRWWSTALVVPAVLAHGFVLIFLFCAEHETVHRTAFRSKRVNDVVAAVVGLVLVLPSRWFRLFHAAHHRYTQDAGLDPELDGWKPPSRSGIVLQQSGVLYWKAMLVVLWQLVRGRADAPWLPKGHSARVVREARLMASVYGVVFVASVATRSLLALQLWIIPVVIGQPFLRWYLLAEHTGLPTGQGIGPGTRTTLTNPVMRFFAWNMPFHTEHHLQPQVPFHGLAAAHVARLSNEAGVVGSLDRGYVRTVARLQRERWRAAPRSG